LEWDVEGTDEFDAWYFALMDADAVAVAKAIDLLEEHGPALSAPYSTSIVTSRHSHMRELRVQSGGRPLRVLYAFDPRRTAIMLLGGDKTGDNRWYDVHVPIADRLYDEYLDELRKEGMI
jgi:hypothetical protein